MNPNFKKMKKKSKILVRARIIAEEVELSRDEYAQLSIEDLRIRTDYLVNGLKENKFTLDDIVVDAFCIAREIIFREHGMLAYTTQMMGAYVVHCGDFAEMYTGEGKSLTILLVAFLNALTKKGVHIVTVNEYLVERDAEFARHAFEKLGITVGYNTSQLSKDVKKEMFAKDITYTTNSELGFDYLRDNMVRSMGEKVIRELFFVIIDEGDSVLIDEARTPLIISGNPKEDFSLYLDIDKIVSSLTKDDYAIDAESNTISLTDSGAKKVETFFKLDNLYSVESSEIVHKVQNALTAHYVFANGREYIVKDDKIYLVDQFTGRVLEGRSYNAGLQQAIQAKERVKIEPENMVMATITYQSFFRLYKRLSAVSGTAMTEAEEFLKIYNMVVVRIPTYRPIIRKDKADYIFGTKTVKWAHVIEEIINRHQKGQPILVGTSSVSDSEIIHAKLKELKIPHQVLNARDNSKEAEIVKLGGQVGAITISTNMAGRGTDIKVSPEAKELGGLYVIGTERHESRRVDNQLRGRTGRQGDPGESRFFTSLEDSLFKRFATDRFAKASEKLEEDFFDSKFFSRMLDKTQKKVEGLNFDIRKNLMDYDNILSLQRELVYKQRDQILLQENNLKIIQNMAKEYAYDLAETLKNKSNSAIVDSEKMASLINDEFLKFDYFPKDEFENMIISSARDFIYAIFETIIFAKFGILSELNALNVIGETLLVNLDQKWTTHIDKMTKLREGVNLRSLEQRSPLNIYIEDGNLLFEKMKSDVVKDVINAICKLSLPKEREILERALKNAQLENFQKKKIQDFFQDKMAEKLRETTQISDSNSSNIDNEYEKSALSQNLYDAEMEHRDDSTKYIFDESNLSQFSEILNSVKNTNEDETDATAFTEYPDKEITLDTIVNDDELKVDNPVKLIDIEEKTQHNLDELKSKIEQDIAIQNQEEKEIENSIKDDNNENIIEKNDNDENIIVENDNEQIENYNISNDINENNNNVENVVIEDIDKDLDDVKLTDNDNKDLDKNDLELVEKLSNVSNVDDNHIEENVAPSVENEENKTTSIDSTNKDDDSDDEKEKVDNVFDDNQEEYQPEKSIDESIDDLESVEIEQDNNDTQMKLSPNDNEQKPGGSKLSSLKPKMKKYDRNDEKSRIYQPTPDEFYNKKHAYNPYYKNVEHSDVLIDENIQNTSESNGDLFDLNVWGDDKDRADKIIHNVFEKNKNKKDEIEIEEFEISKETKNKETVNFNFDKSPDGFNDKNKETIANDNMLATKTNIINETIYPKDVVIKKEDKINNRSLSKNKINDDVFNALKEKFNLKSNSNKKIEQEIVRETSKRYFEQVKEDKKLVKRRKTFDEQLIDLIVEKSKTE